MHKCDCGAETSRSRTIARGKELQTICPTCRPDDFHEQVLYPLDKKFFMGWEAHPEKYIRKENPEGGWMYIAKDELRQDTEELIAAGDKKEQEQKYQERLAEKRAHRRTAPLTAAEIQAAKNRWQRPQTIQ